jgi:hypothetical protein
MKEYKKIRRFSLYKSLSIQAWNMLAKPITLAPIQEGMVQVKVLL